MLEINEVKIKRILNPTSIDLGEFVINPFMGCEFACLYCYVRSNRVVSRKNKAWGKYLDVRVNCPELLEKELLLKKPKVVLLGSTTECFQPQESKYRLSQKILETLNKHKVKYVILTRSPYILNYLEILKQGFCQEIYFTINNFDNEIKSKLEPLTPGFDLRRKAVNRLLDQGLPVVPYFSPLIPWVSDISGIFQKFPKSKKIEFECLNFRLNNINQIMDSIIQVKPELEENYLKMLKEIKFYQQVWFRLREEIGKQAKNANLRYNIYIHNFNGYFNNNYNRE